MKDKLYQALIAKGLALDIQAVLSCDGNQDCIIGLIKDFYNNLNNTSKQNFLKIINEKTGLNISDENLIDVQEISSFDR